MTAILIAGIIAVVVIAAGAYLRWAAGPVVVAYRLGVDMGRQLQAQKGDESARPRHSAQTRKHEAGELAGSSN